MKNPLIAFFALVLLAAIAAPRVHAAEDTMPSLSNVLSNPEGIVDFLHFFDTPESWQAGELQGLVIQPGEAPLLAMTEESEGRFPRRARWISPEIESRIPFTEAVPSWNARTPENTGVNFYMRVRLIETGEWSPWVFMGRWGRATSSPYRRINFDGGMVHVDTLKLDKPADAFQMRADLRSYTFDRVTNPAIRRIAVSYSGTIDTPEERALLNPDPEIAGEWARSLDVPFISQQWGPDSIAGSICSPTSTTMVMNYHGVERDFVENAMAIYDPDYGIFGNWARAVQRAGEFGLDGYVTRFRNYEEVKAKIAEGIPVIASIRFREGEFPSAVFSSSGGHLIVVRGFTPEGDVIVNDPANSELGDGAIYKADELARAWFERGGVGYVIWNGRNQDHQPLRLAAAGE